MQQRSENGKWKATEVNLKASPALKRLILAADPTYRKKTAMVIASEQVSLSGTYWDSGSRSTYAAVSIATGCASIYPQYNPPQFNGPKVDPIEGLINGLVIVKTGVAGNKTALAYVYVTDADFPKVVPA